MPCMACALTLCTACDNFLEVQPYDKMAQDDLYSTQAGFQKALNGVYVELNADALYGQTLTVEMVELMAGNYLVGSDPLIWGDYIDLDNRNFTSSYWRSRLDETWNKAYALILNCNTILEQMDTHRGVFTGDNYNIIKGEALALRALLHFDMFRLFGPVYKLTPQRESIPYHISTTLQVQPLLPACEVMQHVVADLKQAEQLLQHDPVTTTTQHLVNHSTTGDNWLQYRTLRLNYYAVQALLARAYDYMASYEGDITIGENVITHEECVAQACHYAQAVLDAAAVHFPFVDKTNVLGSPQYVDRIFATEVIFALTNTQRGELFKNNNDPDHSPKPVLRMNPTLLEAPYFGGGSESGGSTDDYRYIANWRKNGNDYYCYKYADQSDVSRIEATMIPMIRLGEMYMIMADVYDRDEERPLMAQWVNQLRAHRGVDALDVNSFGPRHWNYEMVREFYAEGQCFFYFKRNYSAILTQYEAPCQFKTASEKLYVVPLPDTETENRQ